MTAAPSELKKRRKLSGLTSMTWAGKKKRSFEMGHANATPRPPFVSMSSKPCEAAAAKTKRNAAVLGARNDAAKVRATNPSKMAKARE